MNAISRILAVMDYAKIVVVETAKDVADGRKSLDDLKRSVAVIRQLEMDLRVAQTEEDEAQEGVRGFHMGEKLNVHPQNNNGVVGKEEKARHA